MSQLFAEVPEALSNTMLIAERCNVDLSFKGYHLPEFPVPEGYTAETYLRHLCRGGFAEALRRPGHRAPRCGRDWITSWASFTRWVSTPTS